MRDTAYEPDMRKLFLIGAPLLAIFAMAVLLRTPPTDRSAMEAKYTNASSQFAENSDGLRVHFRDQGNPDGTPLVLLHGSSASLHSFEPLVLELGDEYRVITYTQPGHGLTGPHPKDDYSFAGMSDALDLVVNELKLEKFVLGGNSMGGWVAWRYTLANPDRVDALILIDAAGMPLRADEAEPPLNLGFKLLGTPLGRILLQHYAPRSLIERSALQSVSVKEIITDEEVDRYWELMRVPGNARAAGLRAMADRETHMADRIGEISAPTLIMWGAEDQLIFASAAQTFAERMRDTQTVIYEGVGHLPMEEAPKRTAADIDRFMDRLALAAANRPGVTP